MRGLRYAAAALVVAAVPLLSAAPAGASLSGPCQASGTVNGVTHNPKTEDSAKVPYKGAVSWEGSVPGSGKRVIGGKVEVKIAFAKVTVGSWGGPSDTYKNHGNFKYGFSRTLAGLKIPVSGFHNDKGFTCSGAMLVELTGSRLSNPALLGSLALTIVSVVNLSLSVRAKRVRQ